MADGWTNPAAITVARVQQLILPVMAQSTTEKGLFAVMKGLAPSNGASGTILPRLTEPDFNAAGNGASAYGSVKEVEPSVVAGRSITYTDLAVLSGTDIFLQARAGVPLESMLRAKLEAYINLAMDQVEILGAAQYANVATSGPDMRITTGATTTGLSALEIEKAAVAADEAGHPVTL